MKNKKSIISAITFVIVGLVITGAASAVIYKQDSNGDNGMAALKAQPLQMVSQGSSPKPLAATQITAGAYNSYHPGIAASPSGIFYAAAEVSQDGSAWQPGVFSSDAAGTTWTEDIEFSYPGAQYNALDSNSVGTYGTFGAPPDQSSIIVFYQAEDPEGNSGVWDWAANGFSNLFNNDILAYNDPNPNATSMGWNLALTGDMTTGSGVPLVLYMEWGPNNYGIIGWINGKTGYVHAANSADQQKVLGYNVYDHNDGANLFVRVVNLAQWNWNSGQQYYYHPDKKTVQIDETTYQVMYPSVAAQNNTVLIVAQKITGSANDIILYRSTNGLSSYTRTDLVASADDETYPQVIFTGAGTAICTYCKNGVLYYKLTEDGGATWGAEAQVSDSQVQNEYRTEALCSKLGAGFAAWEDTRGSVIDIYFDQVTSGPAIPFLAIGAITAKTPKFSAVIENTGTAAATSVQWNITLTGGFILLGKLTSGTEPSIAAGATATVNSKFVFGFGKAVAIKVTAKCAEGPSASGTATGKVILFITKIV